MGNEVYSAAVAIGLGVLVGTALGAALLFAWLPARRAASLDAAQALARR